MIDIEKYGPQCIGNVIRIIDNYSLLINAAYPPLTVGAKVSVYEVCDTIKDLDGTPLGTYDYVKCTLIVKEVFDKFSICTVIPDTCSPFEYALAPVLKKSYSPLNVNESDIKPLSINSESVLIGDPIKLS